MCDLFDCKGWLFDLNWDRFRAIVDAIGEFDLKAELFQKSAPDVVHEAPKATTPSLIKIVAQDDKEKRGSIGLSTWYGGSLLRL